MSEKPTIKPEEKSPNQAVQELTKFLTPLAEGQLIPDFNNQLHDVVRAVRETRKAGNISLTIKIEPAKGSVTQVIVHSDVSVKKPTATKPLSIYFTDEEGGLFRQDPNQMNFKFERPKD